MTVTTMNKTMGIIGIFLIAVIVLVAIGVNYGSVPYTAFPTGCTGFNDISLSSVDYLSNDPVLGGESWVLTVIQNCMGRYAVGSFSKSNIQDPADNAQATKDFKLTMTLDEQKCEYDIREQGFPILTLKQETRHLWKLGLGASEFEAECTAKPYSLSFNKKGWYYTCFWGVETAKHGTLSSADINFKSTIKLEVPGQTPQTATITNQLTRSVDIGTIGTAYWNGNIVTGDSCPSASADRISVAYQNGVWKMIDESKYQTYLVHHQAEVKICISNYLKSLGDTPNTCVEKYNIVSSNALAGKKLISDGGTLGTTFGSVSDGKVFLNLVKTIQYPMITLRLNVDWIGIFIPVSQPKVIYTSSKTFRTGETGYINAQIKNDGTGVGSFNVYADCNSPFGSDSSRIVSLAADTSTTISIPVTVSASKDLTGSCTVCAEDINEPSKKHCKSVSMSAKPQITCTPFKRECAGTTIVQCNAEGTGESVIQECELGCEYKNFQPTCKSQLEPVCGNGICETGETYLTCSADCGTGPPPPPPPYDIDYDTLGIIALVLMVVVFAVMINKEKTKGTGRVGYARKKR